MAIIVRPLVPADRAAWDPLWAGYLTFYRAEIPAAVTDETWRRFHDPAVPLHVVGAFDGVALVGFATYLFHLSTWSTTSYCYLEDLFTAEAARGLGVGRALITAVHDAAEGARASKVYWLTHETNTTAQTLYDRVAERTGFIHYSQALRP
jgi:GNAT superfamily N-acetyltransferase